MTFIKFVRFDIHNGIIKNSRPIILTLIFSFMGGLLHILSLRVYELVHPDYLQLPPLAGDFLITVFGGCRANAMQESGIMFQVPFLWITYVCWMLFLVLRYPLENLNGIGKHQLILARQRSAWWFSKCIWILLETAVSFGAVCAGVCTAGFLRGAEPSLNVNSYMAAEIGINGLAQSPQPWHIAGLLASNLCILAALGILEMLLSLYLKSMYAYLLAASYCLASTYFDAPYFVGNYMMGARSSSFLASGYDWGIGCIIGLWLAALAAIAGWYCFEYYDILGQDES